MNTIYCVVVIFLLPLVNSTLLISVQNTTPPKNTSKEHNHVNFPVKKQLNFHSGADMNETIKCGIVQEKTTEIEEPVVISLPQ